MYFIVSSSATVLLGLLHNEGWNTNLQLMCPDTKGKAEYCRPVVVFPSTHLH